MRKLGTTIYAAAIVIGVCLLGLLVGSEHNEPPQPVPTQSTGNWMQFYTDSIQRNEMPKDHCGDGVAALLIPCDVP